MKSLALAALMLATPFGEPAQRPSGTASCIAATGTPGELLRQREDGLEFLRATGAGLVVHSKLAGMEGCDGVAGARNGAGVAAFSRGGGAVAAVREPGQAWGAPAVVIGGEGQVRTAVSERGDMLVASIGTSVQVVRRPPGGAFGAPARLQASIDNEGGTTLLHAGFTAAGEAVVAWIKPARGEGQGTLFVAQAAAAGAFSPPRRVGAVNWGASFDLAVAPDGRALLLFPSGPRMMLAERSPDGTWGAAGVISAAVPGILAPDPTIALRDDGAAVIAWMDGLDSSVHARSRIAPGPFTRTVVLGPGLSQIPHLPPYLRLLGYSHTLSAPHADFAGEGWDLNPTEPRALFTADGRGLVAWTGLGERDGVWWPGAHAAFLSGDSAERTMVGPETHVIEQAVPVLTDTGAPALAWRDYEGVTRLAVAGAPNAADPPAPRIAVGRITPRVLDRTTRLEVPVRCSAACELHANFDGTIGISDAVELRRAGTVTLELLALSPPTGSVRINLRYGAPGARVMQARTQLVTLGRRPAPGPQRILGLSARRSGRNVVVRWRTRRAVDLQSFAVVGRDRDGDLDSMNGEGGDRVPRQRFEVLLYDPRRKTTRVTVHSQGTYLGPMRTATTRVR